MKVKVPGQLLSDCGSFFTTLYQLFNKIIIRGLPRQNLSNFVSVVLEKLEVSF